MTLLGGCLKSAEQKIAFRVDASSLIGTGHVMRCLTLADELKRRGASSCFVGRHMPQYLREMLESRGHEIKQFAAVSAPSVAGELAHADWLGTSQEFDAREMLQALAGQSWDWLVVDHYALDASWETMLRPRVGHILAIDDLADRQHDCDVLLDQNFYRDMNTRYVGKVPEHCRLLLGPDYAIVREEFRTLREQVAPRMGPVRRILVFFGGVDADNYTGLAIQALLEIGMPNVQVDVVIGAQHPCRESIEAECRRHDGFVCHVQTDRMAELMAAADLSIGAGGSAIWERCCLGLPTITVCTAHNQRDQISDAASDGLVYAPDIGDNMIYTIRHHVISLLENAGVRRLISRRGMQAADGRGVLRVINTMGCNGVVIRPATAGDSRSIFEWRNHPDIRAVSRSTDEICWESHENWFASVLDDPERMLLIGEINGQPLGVVRFDIHNSGADVSIYLVPRNKTQGRGRDLLRSAEQWFVRVRPEIQLLRAEVLGANERSHGLFLADGFWVESTAYFKRLH